MNLISIKNRRSVIFLFINGPHHVYHLIMPALRFAKTNVDLDIKFISGNPRNTAIITETAKTLNITEFELIDIPLPLRYRFHNYKDKIYPPVYTRIKKIAHILSKASAIVSTSHELPEHIHNHGITGPILFYLYHGTGTRAYGFESKLAMFDHIFVPGDYHLNRLRKELPLLNDKLIITGMPKLDWINSRRKNIGPLFCNDNPIFYYNPHWDMRLSSYITWRKFILNFFSENRKYNMIFSAHPLVKHLSEKQEYDIEGDETFFDNILIDHGSERSIDGTYNLMADVYVGDVSSMVTEWVKLMPRPCIFINAHNIDWVDNEDYYFWNYGLVVSGHERFPEFVDKTVRGNKYENIQLKLRDKFIHYGEKTSSELCAESMQTILENNRS